MLLSELGGKFNTAENHGFEEVMIQLLAGMIQRELGAKLGTDAGTAALLQKGTRTFTGLSAPRTVPRRIQLHSGSRQPRLS